MTNKSSFFKALVITLLFFRLQTKDFWSTLSNNLIVKQTNKENTDGILWGNTNND